MQGMARHMSIFSRSRYAPAAERYIDERDIWIGATVRPSKKGGTNRIRVARRVLEISITGRR